MLALSVRPLIVAVALSAAVPAAAQDEGFPIDVEMIRPGLSPMGGFGVDAPQAIAAKTWSVGALLQYENAPLRLYDGDDLLGPLVAHRTVLQLHAGISASKRTSFSLMIPVGGHFGADDTERARNGFGLGDLGVTMRVLIGTWGRFSLGALGTVMLPTGNFEQYMGERLPRLRVGVLGHTDLGRVSLLTNLLAHVREPIATGFDFTAGSELQIDLGVQGHLVPDQLDLIGELISRIGVEPGPDGGRLASEVLLGVRYMPRPGFRIDVAVGRGLTEGYGTTEIRGMVGFTYVRVPKPRPEPIPAVALVEEEEPLPEIEEPPPPPPPPPPPVARLTGEQIVIRDPIEFEQGTTTLRSSSGPVLDGVAEVILGNASVGHVVIEGHASQEGGFRYNYELSGQRARVIYEALILRGVHPKRLSYRGAGEVERVVEGEDPEALERNRRVVFQVVRQYAPDEAPPQLDDAILLPWSGEQQAVVQPVYVPPEVPVAPAPVPEAIPEPPPPERVEAMQDTTFLEAPEEALFEGEVAAPVPEPEPTPDPDATDAPAPEPTP